MEVNKKTKTKRFHQNKKVKLLNVLQSFFDFLLSIFFLTVVAVQRSVQFVGQILLVFVYPFVE